jgi:hypothetical protein
MLCRHLQASTSPTPETQQPFSSHHNRSKRKIKMKFVTLTSALALFATAASALDKPLNIQVDTAVECTRKTQVGEWHEINSSRKWTSY